VLRNQTLLFLQVNEFTILEFNIHGVLKGGKLGENWGGQLLYFIKELTLCLLVLTFLMN